MDATYRHARPLLALAAAALLHAASAAQPPEGGKGPAARGEIKLAAHKYRLEKDSTYRIVVTAEGFTPYVRVMNKFGTSASAIGSQGAARMIFTPFNTDDYEIVVDFDYFGKAPKGPTPYTFLLEKAKFEKEADAKESLRPHEHSFKLDAGTIYVFTVKGKNFNPNVRVAAGDKVLASRSSDDLGNKDREYVTNVIFVPPQAGDYRVLVTSAGTVHLGKGALDYTVSLTTRKPLLTTKGELAKTDPAYKLRRDSFHKAHAVELKGGTLYQIDLNSAFDNYLYLEDAKGNVVSSNDDGGGGRNARILYRPLRTEEFKIIATSFSGGVTGPYTLTVIDVPAPGAPPK